MDLTQRRTALAATLRFIRGRYGRPAARWYLRDYAKRSGSHVAGSKYA